MMLALIAVAASFSNPLPPPRPVIAGDGYPAVYAADAAAYRHALREAKILAQRQRVYHPLGCAPGCSASGTGMSMSKSRPHHCFYRSGRRLVARAVVVRGNRCYWSAHYR